MNLVIGMQNAPRLPEGGASTEIELVCLAKEDDPVAFSALSERYMPILQARAGRYSSIVGVETEDFVQEGLLALYRAVKGYDARTGIQFNTYAITCINNSMVSAIKTHMKSLERRGEIHLDAVDEHQLRKQTTMQADELVEDIFIQMETNSFRLRQMEDLLSEFERHVLKLYLSGQSYQEIARVLSATTKSVDNALQRVRRKLRPEV